MNANFHNKLLFIWMQLIGFDRDQPDCGASQYLQEIGFVPDGICALLFHPDIIHLHRGMEQEYPLFIDNCSYAGSPRNALRERQPWTNHNLRTLATSLKNAGTGLYLSIMGSATNNAFHQEWIYDHPEIMYDGTAFRGGMNVLKRFSDGTYYEDFFIDKLCQTLADYGFEGIQLADGFCPPPGMRHDGDYSTDMVKQFLAHTALALPEDCMQSLGSDTEEAKTLRGRWIWRNLRTEWLHFNAWRWTKFYEKLCARVHAIGRKVIVLGLYCTDPFETLYCIGLNLKQIIDAGVDFIMPNILPTSVYMQPDFRNERPYYFHRYMSIAPLTRAFVPEGKFLSMLGVHDTTEEWDVLHDAPCRFARDLYTMLMYQTVEPDGCRSCMDGLMLCLGDGLTPHDWQWMGDRLEAATSLDASASLSPTVLWSDAAFDNLLPAYIQTRRWTPHKFIYEIFKRGTPLGAVVRSEHIAACRGTLFVPNVDLLSKDEIKAVAAYRNGPVMLTAPVDFDPAAHGMTPDIECSDPQSRYPMKVFTLNAPQSSQLLNPMLAWLDEPDPTPDLEGDPIDAPEFPYTLADTLSFVKVSEGFVKLCSSLLQRLCEQDGPFVCDVPYAAFQLRNGDCRLYLYNTLDDRYDHAVITSRVPIQSVKTISQYPILPVRYAETEDGARRQFKTKLQPSGVTILDVTLE